jgi:hypothetical protein
MMRQIAALVVLVSGLLGVGLSTPGCTGDDATAVSSDASSDGDATSATDTSVSVDAAIDHSQALDASDAADALDAANAMDAPDARPVLDASVGALQQYASQYAQAYCFGQGKCCAGFDAGAFDLAACATANTLKGWRSTLPASASAYTSGHLGLNDEAGAGCISALRAFPCGSITAPQFAAILNACNGVLTGNIANDSGPCVSSFECANGYCSLPTDGAAGTCAPLVGQSGACIPGNDSPDHMCSRAGVAQPRLWCDLTNHPDGGGATCVPPLPNDAGCFNLVTSYWDDYGCASLLCGDNGCGSSTAAYPDPGWCSSYAPTDGGGG